jgi:hypothetical protein
MTFAAAGIAIALAAGTSISLASTSTAASSGIVHVYEIGGVGPTDQDVITGAFTDYGVDHTGALDHGMVNKVVLSKGSTYRTGRAPTRRSTEASRSNWWTP